MSDKKGHVGAPRIGENSNKLHKNMQDVLDQYYLIGLSLSRPGPDYHQNVLLAAAGFKRRLEEDLQSSQPRILPSKKQYLFLFMCLIQWLMLVGYTRSTIYLH